MDNEILVEAIIDIIGFGVSIFIMKRQIRNGLKEKNDVERIKIYKNWYLYIMKVKYNRFLVYDKEYIEQLSEIKAEIELFSSKAIIEAYDSLYDLIDSIYRKYNKYYSDNDPFNDKRNFEIIYDDNTGEEIEEIYKETQIDVIEFEEKVYKYKLKNLPDKNLLELKINCILNIIRIELGNK